MQSNFNRNFQTFILSNDLSNQKAADLINEEMARLDAQNDRIYMANDVWTIVGRGSTPRNHLVMVAIANIIGKSLEDLIVHLYDMSDLSRPDLRRCPCNMEKSPSDRDRRAMLSCSDMVRDFWNEQKPSIAQLFGKMEPDDKTLVLDLVSSIETEGDDVFLSLLVEPEMPLDDEINIWVHYNNASGRPEGVPVDWEDFAERLQQCNCDPCATITRFVHDRFLCTLENDLHLDVTLCDFCRYYDADENGFEMDNGYLVKMRLGGLTRKDMLFLYEQSLEHLKQRLAELEKANKKED